MFLILLRQSKLPDQMNLIVSWHAGLLRKLEAAGVTGKHHEWFKKTTNLTENNV